MLVAAGRRGRGAGGGIRAVARVGEATLELVALHLQLDHRNAPDHTIRCLTDALAELDQDRR